MARLTWLQPFTVTTSREAAHPDILRERARRDGYVLVRGLVPPHDLLAVRAGILRCLMDAGWCDEAARVPAELPRHAEGADPEFMALYDGVQRLETFHRLALHPAVVGLFATLWGEAVLPHPRNIARIMFPRHTGTTTPAHQDHLLIGGTPETWTAWIPLGDCPLALGGLAVMAGSHREPLLAVSPAAGAGGVSVNAEALEYPWVGGDLEAGDVLAFHSHTVHAALPNLTAERMRLSVDFRYQPLSHPVRADSLLPHYGRLSWDEIYAAWASADGQYYWRALEPRVV
jgi:hypothetical protein